MDSTKERKQQSALQRGFDLFDLYDEEDRDIAVKKVLNVFKVKNEYSSCSEMNTDRHGKEY